MGRPGCVMGVYPEVWVTWMHIYHVNKPCKLFFPQFSVSATAAKKAINNMFTQRHVWRVFRKHRCVTSASFFLPFNWHWWTPKRVSVILERIIFRSALLAFRDMSHLSPSRQIWGLDAWWCHEKKKRSSSVGERNTTSMQTFLKKKKGKKVKRIHYHVCWTPASSRAGASYWSSCTTTVII